MRMRGGYANQMFWGQLNSKKSSKGSSSDFVNDSQAEIGSRSSSFARSRMASVGKVSSSILYYTDSRGSILRRGSRTSRGSVYFSEGIVSNFVFLEL